MISRHLLLVILFLLLSTVLAIHVLDDGALLKTAVTGFDDHALPPAVSNQGLPGVSEGGFAGLDFADPGQDLFYKNRSSTDTGGTTRKFNFTTNELKADFSGGGSGSTPARQTFSSKVTRAFTSFFGVFFNFDDDSSGNSGGGNNDGAGTNPFDDGSKGGDDGGRGTPDDDEDIVRTDPPEKDGCGGFIKYFIPGCINR